jgi:cytochrome c oxidase assembly protein subunit 15
MNLQVFLEWFHRLDAALIGLSTLALVGLTLWFRRALPHWLPWASLFALGLILFQGVLGGLTVTQLLRFDIVTAHLGTALLFLCTILVMGIYLLPYRTIVTPIGLQILATITAILIYGQSLLGGLVASRWAVHQCLGDSQLCQVMNRHLFGVIPTTLGVLLLGLMAWRTPTLDADLKKLAYLALGLVIGQILLGWATLHFHLQVEPLTVAHHTIGAALLATSVAFTARSFRSA